MKTIRIQNTSHTYSVGKILCLGQNYAEHAKEMQSEVPKEPVVFLKPATAVIFDGEPISIPRISQEPNHEVELVVAIGKEGKHVRRSDAFSYVLGYGVGLDMTLRDVQRNAKKKGHPWSVAKGFDTSAPVSEFVPAHLVSDPGTLELKCSVNGTVRQQCMTREMIFPVDFVIEYLSRLFTLEVGDLIFTGTPEGVGIVHDGDLIEAELVGLAKTSHRVRML